MQLKNTKNRYGAVGQLFHWAIVALVVVQFVLALQAEGLDTSLERLQLMARHKSFGMTIFMLMVLRLGWRFISPPPPLPDAMAGWERILARGTHWLLYAILLVMPVAGWVTSTAKDLSVSWFGVFTWPDLVTGNETVAELAEGIHETLALVLLVVVGLHIAAALRHHYFKKDSVLLRMLPVRESKIEEVDKR